jgi:hypothetical protein
VRRASFVGLVGLFLVATGAPIARAEPHGAAAAEARCARGRALAARGDAARAHVLLDRCLAAGGGDDATRALRDRLARTLGDGDDAVVTISAKAAGATVALSFLPDEPPLPAPVTVYLPRGRHHLEVRAPGHLPYARDVEVTGRDRLAVFAELVARAPAPSRTAAIDFGDDGAAASVQTAVPRPKQQPTLMPDRFEDRAPGAAADAPAPLRDPMPDARPPARHHPALWLAVGGAVVAGTIAVFLIAR